MKSKAKYKQLPTDQLEQVVKQGKTWSEVLRALGYVRNAGCLNRALRKYLQEKNIDFSHLPNGRNSGLPRKSIVRVRPLEQILVENSECKESRDLKRRLIKAGILEEKCLKCGLLPIWRGKILVLQLDHINGTHTDNRIENLRILCPNCHSQTETFCSRNCRIKLDHELIDI